MPTPAQLVPFRRLVSGLSVVWLVVLLVTFGLRAGFALDLEWMEGGTLQQAMRILYGLPIYERPSLDFVPFLYTPFYSAVLAALGTVFPLDYTLGRVVSIVAWLATCGGIWQIVTAEGKPRAHALAAIGLFCAGYVFSFRWYDIARPDMLMLALTVWGLYFLRHSQQSARRAVIAGVLMALAFWTKQTAAVLIFVSGVGGLMLARTHLWRYVLTIFVIDAIGVYAGMWMTENWLWTYIYELHQSHAFNAERFYRKTWGMFAHAAPFLLLWAGVLLGQRGAELGKRLRAAEKVVPACFSELAARCRDGTGFWLLLALAGLLVSALGYSTQWAEPNAFIPGVCFVAIWLGVTLPTGRLERAGLLLIAAQLVFALFVEPFYQPIQQHGVARGLGLSYRLMDPMRTLPSAQARQQAQQVRESLYAQEGEVFAFHRPWWSVLAGGPGHVGSMGLNDIPVRDRSRLRLELRTAIRAGRYTTLWFDRNPPTWLLPVLTDRFRLAARLTGDQRLLPLTGYMSAAGMVTPYRDPQLVFEWIPEHDAVPAGVEVLWDFEQRDLRQFFPSIKGGAFTRSSVSGLHGVTRHRKRRNRAVGPHGGKALGSSAASRSGLAGLGKLASAPITVRAGEQLSILLGYAGTSAGLRVEFNRVDIGDQPVVLPFGRNTPEWTLTRVVWRVPEAWDGAEVSLHVVDDSPHGAVFVDDFWRHLAG